MRFSAAARNRLRTRLRRLTRTTSQAMAGGLLLWILTALLNVNSKVDTQTARTSEQLTSLQVQVAALYRSADAKRDMADTSREIGLVASRIDRAEQRIEAAERAVSRVTLTAAARAR
jgi:hypothetical protein